MTAAPAGFHSFRTGPTAPAAYDSCHMRFKESNALHATWAREGWRGARGEDEGKGKGEGQGRGKQGWQRVG